MKTTKHNITNTAEPIKPGYKKTSIGIIPEDWKVKRLGDLGKTFNGLTGKTKDDFGVGLPFVSYLNVFRNNKIEENTSFDYVNIESSENQNTLNYGDLIFTTSSETPNEVGISSVVLFKPKEKLYLNSFCFGMRLNDFSILKPEYAVYLLRGQNFRREMYKLAQGSTRYNLSKASFVKIQITVPSLEEQTAIADCLSTWDKAIEKLSALIAAKKEQKKGLMQGLFSGELKVENGELIQAKEGEDFLKDWKKVKFNDLFQRVNSKKHQITSKEYLERGQYPIVDQGKLNIVGFSNQEDKLYQNIPVIVFGDHTREIKLIDFNFIIGADGTQLLKNNRKDNISFLYYLLKNTHIPNLGYSRHMRVLITKKFIIPNLSEQNAIAEVLTTADKEIELLEKKLESFKTQKKGLMQVLLTGTKRLVES